jgi:hypothetical protein
MRRLLVTANVVRSSPILITLMMEALNSSEASVLIRPTLRHTPEDGFLHNHRRENLQLYSDYSDYSAFPIVDSIQLGHCPKSVNCNEPLRHVRTDTHVFPTPAS